MVDVIPPTPLDRSRIRLPSSGCLFTAALPAIVAALCLMVGWPAWQQQHRLQYLEQLGARVETRPASPVWLHDLVNARLGEKYAAGFKDVTAAHLYGTPVTDAGLLNLNGLTRLKRLSLMSTGVTDAGLEHLAGLESLEVLWLSNTEVTDDGLRHLSGLANLTALYLSSTLVTDAGLAHLSALKNLERLDLDNTHVTDAGLQHLSGLANLESLFLENTQVSDAGVEQLEMQLPHLTVFR